MPDYQLYRADDGLALTVRVTEMVIEQVGSTYVLRAPGGHRRDHTDPRAAAHDSSSRESPTAPGRHRPCRCTRRRPT